MSTNILDISSLTLHTPILSDDTSLRRQFARRTHGNDEALDQAYALLESCESHPLAVKMVVVESEPLFGSPPKEIISSACNAIESLVQSLAKPSLAQIGSWADFFYEETCIKRVVPIVEGQTKVCLVWERLHEPASKRPVFRFHDKNNIHGTVWVMLPFRTP